ncbi:MAG: hypothetical protein JRH10_22505 [Deltaproteobacteria bacterium]|nr:hypothetical protein [Deltaproteobacteria bacterium]
MLNGEDLPEVLELQAEVVSIDVRQDGSTPGERGMGLRFLQLSADTQKKLDSIYAGLRAA